MFPPVPKLISEPAVRIPALWSRKRVYSYRTSWWKSYAQVLELVRYYITDSRIVYGPGNPAGFA